MTRRPFSQQEQTLIKRGCFLTAAFIFGLILPSHFTVTSTRSMNHRVYFLDRSVEPEQLIRDAHILFKMRSGYLPQKEALAVKRISCEAGDRLTVAENNYFCNGALLGTAKLFTASGKKIIPFVFNGVIPAHRFFIQGDHPDSLDSRYIGLIRRLDIEAIAHPIF